MSQHATSGRTFLGNLVNDVMIDKPPPAAYARTMASVTPRKLWLASAGDCIVVLAPCKPVFRDYVARTTNVDPAQFDLIQPGSIYPKHALDLVEVLGARDQVAAREIIVPFVLDQRVIDFAARADVRIDGYETLPGPQTLAAIREINTKDGFRKIAAGLDLPVAAGGSAATDGELAARLQEFLVDHTAAIVKMNRSSNGFGTEVVRADYPEPVAEQVAGIVARYGQPPTGWVYEEFLDFTAVPSMEMSVGENGPELFSTSDQRTSNNAWTGMTSPAARASIDRTLPAAHAIGRWLHSRGYRGIFDLDCCLTDDGYVVTEANVRRTGGTYLEEVARRLRRPDESHLHWLADARLGTASLTFEGATRALDSAGLADPKACVRAVLTADTAEIDGKWRYLIIGSDPRVVSDAEEEISGILELK